MNDKPSDKPSIDTPKEQPRRSAAGDRAAEEREARLAAALRANLHRRKAQSREAEAREHGAAADADDPKS